jgi:hypothetical protein
MQKRRRFKHTTSLQDRIAEWAASIRKEAASMPPGPDRDALIKKLQQAERAMHLEAWANSSGLRPPD